MKTLGEALEELRRQARLKQRDVADKAGISMRGYTYIVTDARSPRFDTLMALLDAMDASLTELDTVMSSL